MVVDCEPSLWDLNEESLRAQKAEGVRLTVAGQTVSEQGMMPMLPYLGRY